MHRIRTSRLADRLTIEVEGDFTFDVHREFRAAYRDESAINQYVVDLTRSSYMDSAGLGMLMRLREHVGADRNAILLKCQCDQIRNVFQVAHFDRLFEIQVSTGC